MPAQGCLLGPPCRAVHPQLQPSRGGGDTGAPAAALPVLPSRAPPGRAGDRSDNTPRHPRPPVCSPPCSLGGGEPEGREGQGTRCPTQDRQTDRDRQADSACGDAAPPVPAPTGPPSGGDSRGGTQRPRCRAGAASMVLSVPRCSHGLAPCKWGDPCPPPQPPPAPHIHQHRPPPRCRQPALRSTRPPCPRRWVQGWRRSTSVGTAGTSPRKCGPPQDTAPRTPLHPQAPQLGHGHAVHREMQSQRPPQ